MNILYPSYLIFSMADFGTTWYNGSSDGIVFECTQSGMSAIPGSAVPGCAIPGFLSTGFVAGA